MSAPTVARQEFLDAAESELWASVYVAAVASGNTVMDGKTGRPVGFYAVADNAVVAFRARRGIEATRPVLEDDGAIP